MASRKRAVLIALLLAALLSPGLSFNAQAQTTGFANNDFKATWERTDSQIGQPGVNRGYYWGPLNTSRIVKETYNGVARDVQYFDKSRMEINAAAQPGSKFYVSNGRLASELVEGKRQTGDSAFTSLYPAEINLASDGDDATAPTYASFNKLTAKVADRSNGFAAQAIARNGTVSPVLSHDGQAEAKYVQFVGETGHNIPSVIWDFLNASGPVVEGGKTVTARLSDPWFYTTGYPITEAYWANVKIGGQQREVMIQVFERRVVTYVPAEPNAAFRVQMGNIGQHYYDWAYNGLGKPANVPATPAPGNTPAPQPTTVAGPDCSGIPESKNATVQPNCVRPGQTIRVEFFGFKGGEAISFWITTPDGVVVGTARPIEGGAPQSGRIGGELEIDPDIFDVPGVWAYTFYGSESRNESIARFKVLPAAGGGGGVQPTPAPQGNQDVCSQVPRPNPPATTNAEPACAGINTGVTFIGLGFAPGDDVRFYLTAPDQSAIPASDLTGGEEPSLSVDSSGRVGIRFNGGFTSRAPKGVYAITFEKADGSKKSICYFGLK